MEKTKQPIYFKTEHGESVMIGQDESNWFVVHRLGLTKNDFKRITELIEEQGLVEK